MTSSIERDVGYQRREYKVYTSLVVSCEWCLAGHGEDLRRLRG